YRPEQNDNAIQLVSYQPPGIELPPPVFGPLVQPMPTPSGNGGLIVPLPPKAAEDSSIGVPRGQLGVAAVPELGGIVIRVQNKEDRDLVLRLIKFIVDSSPGARIVIEIIPLKNADATDVTNTLNNLFGRVIFGVNADSINIFGVGNARSATSSTTT